MKRILTATAALAFLAAPALAQSTDGGTTSGGNLVLPPAGATGTATTGGTDAMGDAARTGNTAAPAGTGSAMGTDDTSTSSTTPEAPMANGTSTQGMDPGAAAAGSSSTPSGGLVPGQTPE